MFLEAWIECKGKESIIQSIIGLLNFKMTTTDDGMNIESNDIFDFLTAKGNYMAVKRNLNAIVLNEICYESNTKIFELKASGIDNVGESKTIKALFDSKSLKLLEYIEIQPTNKQNFEIETRGTEVNAQRRS